MGKREDWLKQRLELLTASDAAVVLGLSSFKTPLQLYVEKLGLWETDETERMRWGRRMEGAIAQGYSEETGRSVFTTGEYEIAIHPDLPWLGATLDRATSGSVQFPAPHADPGPLELKNTSRAKDWDEDAPVVYQVQLAIQMACTKAQWGSLAALINGATLKFKDYARNDSFLAVALPKLEEFWMRVQRRDPPPVGSADDLPAVKALFPEPSGPMVTLTEEQATLAEGFFEAKRVKEEAVQFAAFGEANLRTLIGDAEGAILPDGRIIRCKKISVPGRTQIVQPYSYRPLSLSNKE